MCFDDEDSTENPLVAPCLCKGGTRYVHLSCLQKWQASAADDKLENCVATSAERKSACKVCKSRYKTHVRTSDGRLLPLMVHQLPPPFICFLVVTKCVPRGASLLPGTRSLLWVWVSFFVD